MINDVQNNNILAPKADRMANGRFAPGNQIPRKPYQRYADRVNLLQEQYSAEDIIAIASDPKRLHKLPVRDAMIIRQLAVTAQPLFESPTNADVRQEREALLDRLEGSAPQTVYTPDMATPPMSLLDQAKWLCFIMDMGAREAEKQEKVIDNE